MPLPTGHTREKTNSWSLIFDWAYMLGRSPTEGETHHFWSYPEGALKVSYEVSSLFFLWENWAPTEKKIGGF